MYKIAEPKGNFSNCTRHEYNSPETQVLGEVVSELGTNGEKKIFTHTCLHKYS